MSKTYQISIKNTNLTTTVIATVPELDRCLKQLLSTITPKSDMRRVVGLEIEKIFGASIIPPKSKVSETVAILKLSHGTTCLIIQLHLLSSPPPCSLSAFLQRPELSFVGVGIAKSMAALERDYGINCRNPVDLAHLAATVRKTDIFRSYGLLDLANLLYYDEYEEMFRNFSDVALSNWGATPLSDSQIEAATFTCFLCFYLGNQLFGGSMPPPRGGLGGGLRGGRLGGGLRKKL